MMIGVMEFVIRDQNWGLGFGDWDLEIGICDQRLGMEIMIWNCKLWTDIEIDRNGD